MVAKPGSIQSNTWYDIKIEISESTARCYLNDDFLFEIPAPAGPVTASVSKDHETNELIIKMVNSGSEALRASMNINGLSISQFASITTLTGMASQRNSLLSPDLLIPVESSGYVCNSFDYELPPNSFQVFRIKMDIRYQETYKSGNPVPNPLVNIVQIP